MKTDMNEHVSASRPATSGPAPRILTQSRKQVNAHIVGDYQEICRQLETAVAKVQDLVQAKNDLELMAQICRITLEAPDVNEG
jgi:hypothetical protein